MRVVRRAGAVVVGITLCAGLLATSPSVAQQREFANPLVTPDAGDLDIRTLRVDATTRRVTVRLTGDKISTATHAQVGLGQAAANPATLPFVNLTANKVEGSWELLGRRIGNGSEVIPETAMSIEANGNSLAFSVNYDEIGWTKPMYVLGVVRADGVTRRAAANADLNGFGPVTAAPDMSKTQLSLSAPRQVSGKGGVQATAVARPAVPGRFDLFDGATRLQSTVTAAGTVRFAVPAGLKPGVHRLRVRYTPTDVLRHAPSDGTAVLTVLAPVRRTVTLLKLSKARQVRGKTPARAKVVVSGAPAGTVTVMDGAKRLRKVTVRNGKGTVVLPKNLKAGIHRIRAVFRPADPRAVLGSTSKTVRLKVTKR